MHLCEHAQITITFLRHNAHDSGHCVLLTNYNALIYRVYLGVPSYLPLEMHMHVWQPDLHTIHNADLITHYACVRFRVCVCTD